MDELFDKYYEDISARNLSENTRQAYVRDLTQFRVFLKEKKLSLQEVDKMTLMSYMQNLNKLGKAESSIVRNLVAVRNLFKYLTRAGYVKYNHAEDYELPKVTRTFPQTLTVDEVDRLLSTPDLSNDKGLRDKAMLELMYAAGIKVTEMLDLTVMDINLKLNYIKCRGSKGKERVIPFGSCARQHLENYLKIRGNFNKDDLPLLFLNTQGERMTRQGFWKIIKFYSRLAGIEKTINLYTLRHSFAVHILQNGADMKSLQELLGYSDISSIQKYIDMTSRSRLVEVYNNSHPRA